MFQTPMMLIFRVYSLRSSAGKVLEDSLPPVRMTGQTQLHCIANGRRQLEKAGTKSKWPCQTQERHGHTWKINENQSIYCMYIWHITSIFFVFPGKSWKWSFSMSWCKKPPRPEDRPPVPKRPQTAGTTGRYVKPDIMRLGEAAENLWWCHLQRVITSYRKMCL